MCSRYLTKDGQYEDGALRYSMDACYDLCIQNHVMQRCQCIDGTITFTDLELKSNLTMCGHMNIAHDVIPTDRDVANALQSLDCYFTFKSEFIRNNVQLEDCHCPVPCTEYNYQRELSSSPWPHRSVSLFRPPMI